MHITNNKYATDQELVRAVKQGQQTAIEYWFRTYHDQLLSLALKKAQNSKDAEELVQETFINCLRNIQTFQGKSSFSTWIKSILYHEIADYYRKLYAKKAIRTLPMGDFLLNLPLEDSHEVSQKVRLVLNKLAKEKRELLLLKYVDQKKVKDIAKRMGKTVKSVESDLFRARQEFRNLYALEFNLSND